MSRLGWVPAGSGANHLSQIAKLRAAERGIQLLGAFNCNVKQRLCCNSALANRRSESEAVFGEIGGTISDIQGCGVRSALHPRQVP